MTRPGAGSRPHGKISVVLVDDSGPQQQDYADKTRRVPREHQGFSSSECLRIFLRRFDPLLLAPTVSTAVD